jgi:hypothetical protein
MALVKIQWQPRRRQLRQFGMVVLPAVCAIATVSAHRHGAAPRALAALGVVAAAAFLVGLLRPQWLRPLFVGLSLVTFPIGWVVSYAVLTALFVTVFVPAGVIMWLVRHDPMARKLDRSAPSYWTPRDRPSDISRYFRQF